MHATRGVLGERFLKLKFSHALLSLLRYAVRLFCLKLFLDRFVQTAAPVNGRVEAALSKDCACYVKRALSTYICIVWFVWTRFIAAHLANCRRLIIFLFWNIHLITKRQKWVRGSVGLSSPWHVGDMDALRTVSETAKLRMRGMLQILVAAVRPLACFR